MPSRRDAAEQSRTLTYRQRSAQILGWTYVVVAVLLIVSVLSSWSRQANPGLLAWLTVGLGVAWALFLRPHVRLTPEGVTLANVVRDTSIPWALVEDVHTRWNLEVFTPERSYTSWAISTQVQRPRSVLSAGLLGAGGRARSGASGRGGGLLEIDPRPSAPPPGAEVAVTARGVVDMIERTRVDYVEAVAAGDLQLPEQPQVLRRWQVLPAAAVGIPLLAALAVVLT